MGINNGDYILFYTIMLYNISKIVYNYFLYHIFVSKDNDMLKAYKYRLNPTSEQISLMERTFGSTRFIYNWALQTKIEAYQDNKKSLTAVDLCKKLTDLKKQEEYAWLNEVSNECLQQSIRNLDQALPDFSGRRKASRSSNQSEDQGNRSRISLMSI